MARIARIEEYRKRRHRAALRRRGSPLHKTAELRGEPSESVWAIPAGPHKRDTRLRSVLGSLARRICSYPGVAGVLYHRNEDRIVVHIVAPRPMTEPMRLLADTWSEELQTQHPAFAWNVGVSHAPPGDLHAYRCLFWRGSG